MLTQGYSEQIRVAICRSRTYDIPITSLDALPLSYRKLVEARPLNDNHGQILRKNSAFYLSTHLSHILDSFATPFLPFNVAWGKRSENSAHDWKWTSLCPTLIGWGGGGGGWKRLSEVPKMCTGMSVPKEFVHDRRFQWPMSLYTARTAIVCSVHWFLDI